jgi:hypothetical protein
VLDGWSFARLITELIIEYAAQLTATQAALPPIPRTRYRDFIAVERKAMGDEAHAQFWRTITSSCGDASLPELAGGEVNGEFAFRRAVNADTEAALHRVAAGLGVPLKSVFFAAHMMALHELTERPDVVSGLQVNCRLDDEGGDQVLGVFLNIVPVHLSVGAGTWADLVLAAFEAERRAQEFRRLPLARIQRLAGHDRKLFDVVFNYTDFHVFDELRRLPQVRPRDWWFSDRHSFPLALDVARPPGTGTRFVQVTTGADARLAGTGARLGEITDHFLREIANDPYGPIADARKDTA